jgi:hypothetical protein
MRFVDALLAWVITSDLLMYSLHRHPRITWRLAVIAAAAYLLSSVWRLAKSRRSRRDFTAEFGEGPWRR